jgi:hypothetical protein
VISFLTNHQRDDNRSPTPDCSVAVCINPLPEENKVANPGFLRHSLTLLQSSSHLCIHLYLKGTNEHFQVGGYCCNFYMTFQEEAHSSNYRSS